jgi:hypothetical protein
MSGNKKQGGGSGAGFTALVGLAALAVGVVATKAYDHFSAKQTADQPSEQPPSSNQ